jgi:hypothetical protein
MNTIGRAAKAQTTTQLAVVKKYISLGRSCETSGRLRPISASPQINVIRLDHRKAPSSSTRSYTTNVNMGIAMLTARVIRKTPKMKPTSRIAARDIRLAYEIRAVQYPMLNLGLP